jgi:hypothetical protein
MMFSGAIPQKILVRMGKIYIGKPLKTKNRKELIASMKEHYWQYLRADNGGLPDDYTPPPKLRAYAPEEDLRVLPSVVG